MIASKHESGCIGHRHPDVVREGTCDGSGPHRGTPARRNRDLHRDGRRTIVGLVWQLRKAKSPERIAWAYRCLAANVRFLRHAQILDYDEAAIQRYEDLKRMRLKVRKMDLQIAATALQHGAIVVTRNTHDFKKVPGLTVEDWSK
jgi:predicted nucleic acid-binding protein